MDILSSLFQGFAIALMPSNLIFAFLGALIGTAIGVLPGLGPAATIALLLPITYWLSPTPAIIMLAGIYYGSMYGGSTTSILLNIPGEASSVITCIDGYKMALKGRAGAALGISAIGSFIAGTIGVIGLTLFAPPLAKIALQFGPSETFSLAMVGLLLTITLSGKSIIKSLIMVAFGLFLGAIGADPVTGKLRFTFGLVGLEGGLDFVTLAMGTFGLGEIFFNLESVLKMEILTTKVGKIFPTRQDLRQSKGAIFRGAIIGFLLGIIPGGGATMSSIASYTVEKKYSDHPEEFGNGAIEGVAGPESANNAASSSAFITLLTLGIPGHAATAVIFSALVMKGITPGPFLATKHPDLFWGFIASMYIGNVMLLILNLPLVGIWVQMLRVPYKILSPLIILFSTVGVYCVNNDPFDIYALIFFGVVGYFIKKFKFEPGPLLIAFILGDIIEISMRQALLISGGDLSIFVLRPISGGILGLFVSLVIGQLVIGAMNHYKTRRDAEN
jgi:putative tricarboxylic transport membrane protein